MTTAADPEKAGGVDFRDDGSVEDSDLNPRDGT